MVGSRATRQYGTVLSASHWAPCPLLVCSRFDFDHPLAVGSGEATHLWLGPWSIRLDHGDWGACKIF
jgi:hypothetical protein